MSRRRDWEPEDKRVIRFCPRANVFDDTTGVDVSDTCVDDERVERRNWRVV